MLKGQQNVIFLKNSLSLLTKQQVKKIGGRMHKLG